MPMKLWHSWELIPWARLLQAILGFLEFGSMERGTCSTMNITRLSDLHNLSLILELLQRLVDSDLDWKHRDATRNTDTTHWQWNVPGSTFMLDVDVFLYKVGFESRFLMIYYVLNLQDIIVDDDGKSSCDFSTCEDAPTASAVEAFAASNDVWIPAFTSVYDKMLAHGATELNDLS